MTLTQHKSSLFRICIKHLFSCNVFSRSTYLYRFPIPPNGRLAFIISISNVSSRTNCSYDWRTLSISDKNRSAFNWDNIMNGRDMGKSNSGHCTDMRPRSEGSMNSVMFLMTDWKSNLKLFKMFGIPLISRSWKVTLYLWMSY